MRSFTNLNYLEISFNIYKILSGILLYMGGGRWIEYRRGFVHSYYPYKEIEIDTNVEQGDIKINSGK